MPALSVILPVYNAGAFLRQTIDSVLHQSFTDFEFIIINDGSSDNSWEIICGYNDERIVKVNQQNKGLAATLNVGIAMAQAPIIARQDNDDISHPLRFEKQLSFLEQHPSVALLGCAANIIDENGLHTGRFHRHATASAELRFLVLFDNPFVHTSVMFRKSAVLEVGGYSVGTSFFEDHRLWSQLAQKYSVCNLSEILVDYREVQQGMSKSANDYSDKVIFQACENIAALLPKYNTAEIKTFVTQSRGEGPFTNLPSDYRKFVEFLNTLQSVFCERYKQASGAVKPAVQRIRRQFLRSYYNSVINNEQSSFYKKTEARIKRRLLLMMFGK